MTTEVLKFEEFELNKNTREIQVSGETVAVEPQVFSLLIYLIENKERVISKDELIENIWEGRFVSESAISSRIKSARKTLNDDGTTKFDWEGSIGIEQTWKNIQVHLKTKNSQIKMYEHRGFGGNSWDSRHLTNFFNYDKPYNFGMQVTKMFSSSDRFDEKVLSSLTMGVGNYHVIDRDIYCWALAGDDEKVLRSFKAEP